jgi:hypothetical protein
MWKRKVMESIQILVRGKLRGKVLQNGAICVESYQINQDEHVVLAMREHPYDPYVVWYSDKEGNCRQGDYCHTLDEAMQRALKRSGWGK